MQRCRATSGAGAYQPRSGPGRRRSRRSLTPPRSRLWGATNGVSIGRPPVALRQSCSATSGACDAPSHSPCRRTSAPTRNAWPMRRLPLSAPSRPCRDCASPLRSTTPSMVHRDRQPPLKRCRHPPAPSSSPLDSGGSMRGPPRASPRSCSLPKHAVPQRPTSAGCGASTTLGRSSRPPGRPAQQMLSANPSRSGVSGPRPTRPMLPPLELSRRSSLATIARWTVRPRRWRSNRLSHHSAPRPDAATDSWIFAWACSPAAPHLRGTHPPTQVLMQ